MEHRDHASAKTIEIEQIIKAWDRVIDSCTVDVDLTAEKDHSHLNVNEKDYIQREHSADERTSHGL